MLNMNDLKSLKDMFNRSKDRDIEIQAQREQLEKDMEEVWAERKPEYEDSTIQGFDEWLNENTAEDNSKPKIQRYHKKRNPYFKLGD